MKNTLSSCFLLMSTCAILFLTGCAQTSLRGEKSGWGTAQIYNETTLAMPIFPGKRTPSNENKWAALAYTDQLAVLNAPEMAYLLGIGIAQNYATAQEAEAAAMLICEADKIPGCKLKTTFQAQCLALAYDYKNLVYSWSIATTEEDAEKQAMLLCEQQASENACKPFGTICPDLANSTSEAPLAESHPEDAALLAHNLAVFSRNIAVLRDQGISQEEISKKFEHGDEDSGEAALNALYLQQIKIVYGPFKNYSPEQIYRTQMFSILYDML
ncbi:MAG: DUF4189 domain-containing protein [Saezia sp.]